MVDAGRHTSLLRIQEEEGKTRLTSRVWARALDEGDELAQELFVLAVDTLGTGIGSVVNVLDLEMVVVGGGLAEKLGQSLADRIAEATRPWLLQPAPDLRFVAAALGDDSGLVGAASLARSLVISG
ncbi:MAG: ROK family protein [Pseudonocardia sp.]